MKPNESPSHNPPNLSRRAAIKTAAAGLAGMATASKLARGDVEGGPTSHAPAEKPGFTIESPAVAVRPLDTVTVQCHGTGREAESQRYAKLADDFMERLK